MEPQEILTFKRDYIVRAISEKNHDYSGVMSSISSVDVRVTGVTGILVDNDNNYIYFLNHNDVVGAFRKDRVLWYNAI